MCRRHIFRGGNQRRIFFFLSETALRGRRQALFPKRAWTKRGRRGDTPLLHFPRVRRDRLGLLYLLPADVSLSYPWAPPPSAGQWCTSPPCRGDPCGRPRLCKPALLLPPFHYFDRRKGSARPKRADPFLLLRGKRLLRAHNVRPYGFISRPWAARPR